MQQLHESPDAESTTPYPIKYFVVGEGGITFDRQECSIKMGQADAKKQPNKKPHQNVDAAVAAAVAASHDPSARSVPCVFCHAGFCARNRSSIFFMRFGLSPAYSSVWFSASLSIEL